MRKCILSFALVLVLILSMSTLTYAATVNYHYTVTKTGTYAQEEIVSNNSVVHREGLTDTIQYYIDTATLTFDRSQFSSLYESELMLAYRAEGLREYLNLPMGSHTETIRESAPAGVYSALLITTFARGSWNVTNDYGMLSRGTFSGSPVSYTIRIERN